MCMFRFRAEPEPFIMQDVDGLIVKIQAECCVCKKKVTLQQAGAPESVTTMLRMTPGQMAMATVILQSDGQQPFEVMQLRQIQADDIMHEKLHKFQAFEYEKFVTGSLQIELTTTPSVDVQTVLSTPRQAKRLKIQNTNEIADAM